MVTSRTWNNIATVTSNQLFETKWEFKMKANDFYVVFNISINRDGTANPTITPSKNPST